MSTCSIKHDSEYKLIYRNIESPISIKHDSEYKLIYRNIESPIRLSRLRWYTIGQDLSLAFLNVMNPSRKIKTLQDAKRSALYSSETYGDEYGKRAERANVIKFILAIFGIRTNKKVQELRETNTM